MKREGVLGNTLQKQSRKKRRTYPAWFRVKKGLPDRYRLFFQFDTTSSKIVYGWLNDEKTLRKDGAKSDVYRVFTRMLDRGQIPANFFETMKDSNALQEINILKNDPLD